MKRIIAFLAALMTATAALADVTLLNVSYDPTRELYQAFHFVGWPRTLMVRSAFEGAMS